MDFFDYLAAFLLFFLAIRFLVTVFNFFTWPILYRKKIQSDSTSTVSILIPARNEEKNIKSLLKNTLEHIHEANVIEILVLDDHSVDDTSKIVESFALKNPKVQLLKSKTLPLEWLGKNWACHQLAEAAKGEYMMFLDADVEISSNLIPMALQRVKKYDLSLLSLFPEQKMLSFGEKLVVPLMHFLLLNLLPIRLVRTTKDASLAAANGQFMFFKSKDYHKYKFHELVKNNVLDDVNIMKNVKKLELKGEALLGNNLISCRMYSDGNEAFKGFSKNLFPGFGRSILGMFAYFLLIFWLWLPVFIFSKIYFSISAILLILISRAMISKMANQSVWTNLWLHPFQMCAYTAIGLNSMYLHLNNKVSWKGRKV